MSSSCVAFAARAGDALRPDSWTALGLNLGPIDSLHGWLGVAWCLPWRGMS